MNQSPHSSTDSSPPITGEAPWPGSKSMPRWNLGELIEAPVWEPKNWTAMLGPALLMAGAAIGGGEWLLGPTVTARYGGSLMWLATFSILGQVVYNLEISRYTLYSGEPIFTGKFRTLPGPQFWVFAYLLLDFGSVFPYLATSAATPLATVYLGHVPLESVPAEKSLMQGLGMAVFLTAFLPLIFGGRIYNALKLVMSFKIVTVLGFLLFLGLFFSSVGTWTDIFTGFFKVGNVPILRGEDANGNGVLDAGEDWDKDGHLDVVEPLLKFDSQGRPDKKTDESLEPRYKITLDTNNDGVPDAIDLDRDGKPDEIVDMNKGQPNKSPDFWPALKKDSEGIESIEFNDRLDPAAKGQDKILRLRVTSPKAGVPKLRFLDLDGDGTRDGDNVDNVFSAMIAGRSVRVELGMIAYLAAFAAIAGSGGLSNTPTSNYTRDQGWGMGHHVGAIPSLVGGQNITLSHEGTVFPITPLHLERWKRWYRHVMRDQLVIWMPACFLGIALPSMLSVEFLKRGTEASSWSSAVMTASGVGERVQSQAGVSAGHLCYYLTLFCGFLVLAPSMATTADGVIRRWVDVFWTASARLRKLPITSIKYVYFAVLCGYMVFGLLAIKFIPDSGSLVKIGTNIMNFALGFSCWHTLVLNTVLLPKEIRPNWLIRILMFLAGLFFLALASLTTLKAIGWV